MISSVSAARLRTVLIASVLFGAHITAASAQSLPSPWSNRDIGAPALAGSATQSNGIYTIQAAGTDIWNTSDQFHFVYQQVSGDVEIIARLDSLVKQHEWTKAGVMIRASLNADSAHGFALTSAMNGSHYQRRTGTAGVSTTTDGTPTGAPMWLRAVRAGTRVTTYWSTNGTSWTQIGYDTIALGTSAYVGLAATSVNPGARTTAVFSNVRVTGGTAPTGALPSGQRNQDIGAPAVAGSATYSGGTYTVRGAGTDIWDAADQFQFVYQPITGNVDVVARVQSITNQNAWSKAGVMVRESLTASSTHATMLTSVNKGYAFQRRPSTGAYSLNTSGGTGAPPGWVRLVRTGDLFEAYRSSNGTSWTRVGSDTIPMNQTVYVGIAVTSHNATAATTAVVTNFSATASATGNQPPAVSLTAPVNGSQVTGPATVTMTATASDPEGRMASVDFYAGSTLVARDTTAPYAASWAASAAGTYALTAVAYDADGGTTTSSTVTFTVAAAPAPTSPRYVVFTASSNHATAVTNYVLQVFAAGANPATATPIATSDLGKPTPAANNDITVDRGTFFTSLAAGNYVATITAIGTGGQTQSAAVTFTR